SDAITSSTPLRLTVAARLAFPDGSVSVRTLRLEASRGRLIIERIGNKDFTTLAAIEAMRELCRARYVILDRGREIGTGFGEPDQRGAEEAFGRYLADKHRPDFGDGHPSKVAVADALTYYLESLRDDHSGPEPYHVDRLLEGLGDLTCDAINIDACR
ncbi:hypothetical protein LTR94_030520, partial [Friedmanniomyces endolithicus]